MAKITLTLNNVRGEVFSGFAVSHDLPALTGSDKQVAWANTIRDAAIADFVQTRIVDRVQFEVAGRSCWLKHETWTANAQPQVDIINAKPIMQQIADALAPITSAKDWIEAAGGSKSMLTIQALMQRVAR